MNARALLESGVGDAIRAEIDRLITTNSHLEEERDALVLKCVELETDLNDKKTRLDDLEGDMVEQDAHLRQLELEVKEKIALLESEVKEKNALLENVRPGSADLKASDVVTVETQVGDHSLNESDDSSGDSRVPESMLDRSVSGGLFCLNSWNTVSLIHSSH